MASEWREKTLSEFAVPKGISYGIVQPGQHESEGIPIIRVSDLIDGRIDTSAPLRVAPAIEANYARTRLEGGELLVSLVGTLGRIAIVPEELKGWNVARAVGVIRLKDPADAPWLKLCLEKSEMQHEIASKANTTVQHTFNLGDLQELKIPFPDKNIRAQILDLITPFSDKIELNRQMNRTLEAMARALFKSWFVDFDPVRAKMRGEQPEGMDAETAALFPDELVEVDGREVPKGWELQPLSTVADVNWGNTSITKASYSLTGFDAYSASGQDGKLTFFENDRLGVVVSAIGANSGLTWLARGKWTSIKNTLRFWSIDKNISTEYLYLFTEGKEKWPLRGSAQPFIAQGDARRIDILVPCAAVSIKFATAVTGLFEAIWQNDNESAKLAQLRDALLPRLLAGEIDVSGWGQD